MKLTPEQKKYKKELFKLVKKKKTEFNQINNILQVSELPISIRNQIDENLFQNSIKSTNNLKLLKMLHYNGCNKDTDKVTEEDNLSNSINLLFNLCPKKDIKEIFYWLLSIGSKIKCDVIYYNKIYKEENIEELNLFFYLLKIRNKEKAEVYLDYLINERKEIFDYRDDKNGNLFHLLFARTNNFNIHYVNLDKLLQYIDINHKNNDGDTPLHIGLKEKHNIVNIYNKLKQKNYINDKLRNKDNISVRKMYLNKINPQNGNFVYKM